MIENFTVTFDRRLEVVKRFLRSSEDTFAENSTRMLVSVFEQLVGRFLSIQSVNDDQGLGLIKDSVAIGVSILRQILVKLRIQLLLGLLDKDKAAHNNEYFSHGLLLLLADLAFSQLQQKWLRLAEVSTSALGQVSAQEVYDSLALDIRKLANL